MFINTYIYIYVCKRNLYVLYDAWLCLLVTPSFLDFLGFLGFFCFFFLIFRIFRIFRIFSLKKIEKFKNRILKIL